MRKLALLLAVASLVAPGCKKNKCYDCTLRFTSDGKPVPDSLWTYGTNSKTCDKETADYMKEHPVHIEDGGGHVIKDYYWDCK